VPLLEKAGAGFSAVAREMVNPNVTNDWVIKAGNNYKVGGGSNIYFDSSLVMRVERDDWVQRKREGQRPLIFGERHRVTIKKTKIAGKDDKVVIFYFHTSNGTLIPAGFDRGRDVLELAMRFGIVTKGRSGGMVWGQERWRGETEIVEWAASHPAELKAFEAQVRAQFDDHQPVEHDEDGVVS
jgi:hypothetical protein